MSCTHWKRRRGKIFYSELARAVAPRTVSWATPGELAADLDPKNVQTPALDVIDAALVRAYNTPDARLIISMPPQEGKSQRATRRFTEWVLSKDPDKRVIIASYQAAIASDWGRTIRNDIREHGDKMQIELAADSSAAHYWHIRGHAGSLFCTGVGGSMTGKPADVLIIDDPVRGMEDARSEAYQRRAWSWWTSTASTRLAPGAPVIMILTRWHENDLAGQVMANQPGEWEYIRIPAQADHRPEYGETDILGREPGEFMISARGRSRENWEKRKRDANPQAWAALYQGTPAPDEGGIFPKSDDLARYTSPIWVEKPDGSRTFPGVANGGMLVQSWDLTFKDTSGSDYAVGQTWYAEGNTAYLVDMVRERMNFTRTCEAIEAMAAKYPQATIKYVEDKANGPAVIDSLRSRVPGIIPVNPEGGKVVRANAVTAYIHAKNVLFPTPQLLPNVEELITEMRQFPAGAHDDTVDAMTQALNQIFHHPIYGGYDDTQDYTESDYEIGYAY